MKPAVTLDHVLAAVDSAFSLSRYRALSPALIRAVLAAESSETNHRFLRLAVDAELDDVALALAWRRAVQVVVDTNLTYRWGSRKRRSRLQQLARDPEMLAAIQATVANSEDVRLDLLAVLVADGSDASFDALVPHLDPALVERDARLDRLTRLKIHAARTPALDAVFAEIADSLAERRTASPALALGETIGLGTCTSLWFDASLYSTLQRGARVNAHVHVDSRSATWFRVSVVRAVDFHHAYSSFDADEIEDDALAIGRCAPAELPAWLARVATQLDVRWDHTSIRTGLRGAKRQRVLDWLAGDVV